MVRSGLIRLLTASDESYDAHAYTAAPQVQPLGTKLVVSCKVLRAGDGQRPGALLSDRV